MGIDQLCATAREMQTVALRTAQQIIPQLSGPPGAHPQIDHELITYLPGADCFAWTTETTAAVWAIAPQVQDETTIAEDLLQKDRSAASGGLTGPCRHRIPTSKPISTSIATTHTDYSSSRRRWPRRLPPPSVHPCGLIAPTRFVIPWNVTIGSLRTRP
jgi:hypothetical protein